MPRLLTVEEVAERLCLTTDYVYRLCREGRLPHVRFGRAIRFRENALDAWLEAVERGTVGGQTSGAALR